MDGLKKAKSSVEKDKERVENILFVTLTNIGDVILTTPVIGILLSQFPQAKITVVASPQSVNLFEGNPFLHRVLVYDKFLKLSQKIKFFLNLRKEKFDLIIDLKNTFLGLLLKPKYKTPLFRENREKIYKKDFFLNILKNAVPRHLFPDFNSEEVPFYIWTSDEDKNNAQELLGRFYSANKKLIAISPFARSDTKSWPFESFTELTGRLGEREDLEVVLLGSKEEEKNCRRFIEALGGTIYNLCGKTNLRVLSEVLKRCSCLITNDSATMHLSSAVGTGVVAIFGPTDTRKYAPRGPKHRIITAGLDCQPCEKAQCVFEKKPADCLTSISVDEVFNKVMEILGP